MNQKAFKLRLDSPATYSIRLQGMMGESWSNRMGGMVIEISLEPGKAPVTILTGPLMDQTALWGVLNSAYDLGFPLLSVTCLNELADT